ncbi:hypothetical protein HHK36_024453 [Tetracentron sinense]|uniref:non-specific serine/threonine protein kinase n=1 Tax=Tetracentron sinense TaxID=13715 RepID=A0A834YJF1_TETSI|nr:hypothetical protein HHK36_024453 [Tetracentron sinense]
MCCSSVMKWRGIPKNLISVLSLDVFFLFWIFSYANGDVVDEKSVLLQFKSSVSDSSGILSGWNSTSSNHCSWFGVFCDSKSRVLSLNITGGSSRGNSEAFSGSKFAQFPFYGFGIRNHLGSNGSLVGKLSPVIGKLTGLRVLSLSFNDLSGEIPIEVWGLAKLQVLDLEGNSLTGTLPIEFRGLRRLRVLNLGFNKILGEIPGSLLNCVGLEILNLAGNQVNGTIPWFLGSFSELRGLYLSLNRLGGSIPDELGNSCKNLEHLDLSGNFLVGGIPRNLGNCIGLQSLLLFSNLLEDIIPPELGRLQKLEVLDVSRNSLSGPIPPELGSCSELSILVLSNLFDPLSISKNPRGDLSFGSPSAAYDDYNYFQGAIPVEITTLQKLKIIWAPKTTLEGKFPSNWGACDGLEMINFAQNFLTGEIPEMLNHCKNLHFLDLSSNRLTGELSEKLPVPCMTMFDVSGNLLSGSILRFNGSFCPQISSLNRYLVQPYSLSSAYLSFFAYIAQNGTALPPFGASGSLTIFHNFGENNFTGPLPSLPISPERLGKQTVYAFLAGGNKLAGSFPGDLFGNCDRLNGMIANISNNLMSGQIPENIGSMCRSLKVLDASGNRITGSMPQSFEDLDSLVTLDLSRNILQGQIPVGLGRLKGLKYLSLAGNNLTGFIPSSLGQLSSLEVLELSSNSLSGEIPKDLVNLRNLTVLQLKNNRLTGQIPSDLAHLTSLSSFNVSFNNLSGSLPLNDNLMKCSSVFGNPFLRSCQLFSLYVPSSDMQSRNWDSQNFTDSPSGSATRSHNNGFSSIEIASITSASAIVSVLLALIILFLCTRKCIPKSGVQGSRRREVTIFVDIGVPLTFEIVVRATGSFNTSNCIGNGGFGATYKAEISPGVLVAVKRLSIGRFQGVQQFDAEIKTLGRIRHQNLVTLIGYHASETQMFLIYNYLSGGNLEKFIQERSSRAVDWRILHKIAIDIARALAYLHDQCVPRVLHRDVKPSNILLDNDFNAYLSDFGLARLLGTSETHATTGVAGTFGYVAPEYAMTCRVSDKADVYSYGVVLLELISDKKVLDPSFSPYGNGFNIVAWACMLLRRGQAKEFFTAGLWDSGPHDDLVDTLHLAVVCTVDSLSIRPTMKQVVQRLKQLQPPSC